MEIIAKAWTAFLLEFSNLDIGNLSPCITWKDSYSFYGDFWGGKSGFFLSWNVVFFGVHICLGMGECDRFFYFFVPKPYFFLLH